jgi:ribose transport system permease protein
MKFKKGNLNAKHIKQLLFENIIVVFLVVLFIACIIATEDFLTDFNLTNLLRQYAAPTIMALGMLLVILTGGIDLSIGSIVAVANVVCAMMIVQSGIDPILSILAAIGVGLLSGAISGYLVAYRKVAPFIATLAMMSIASSFSFIFSEGTNIAIRDAGWVDFGKMYLFQGPGVLGLPVQAFIMIVFVIILFLILRFTSYGRLVTAIGSNEEAVRLSGVRVNAIKFSVYCISGAFAAIASILILTRSCVGTGRIGQGYELNAIAACVIGGASLSGGVGKISGAVIGVLILGVLNNILNLLSVPPTIQPAIKGAIILLAVYLNSVKGRKFG